LKEGGGEEGSVGRRIKGEQQEAVNFHYWCSLGTKSTEDGSLNLESLWGSEEEYSNPNVLNIIKIPRTEGSE